MTQRYVRCPLCGAPYNFYTFYAGEQSACGACRTTASVEITIDASGVDWRCARPEVIPAPESPVDRLIRECGGVPPREEG